MKKARMLLKAGVKVSVVALALIVVLVFEGIVCKNLPENMDSFYVLLIFWGLGSAVIAFALSTLENPRLKPVAVVVAGWTSAAIGVYLGCGGGF